jgi:hypothetical protein
MCYSAMLLTTPVMPCSCTTFFVTLEPTLHATGACKPTLRPKPQQLLQRHAAHHSHDAVLLHHLAELNNMLPVPRKLQQVLTVNDNCWVLLLTTRAPAPPALAGSNAMQKHITAPVIAAAHHSGDAVLLHHLLLYWCRVQLCNLTTQTF